MVLERNCVWVFDVEMLEREVHEDLKHFGVGEGSVLGHSRIRCWGRQPIGTYNIQHLVVGEGSVLATGTFNHKVLEKTAY